MPALALALALVLDLALDMVLDLATDFMLIPSKTQSPGTSELAYSTSFCEKYGLILALAASVTVVIAHITRRLSCPGTQPSAITHARRPHQVPTTMSLAHNW